MCSDIAEFFTTLLNQLFYSQLACMKVVRCDANRFFLEMTVNGDERQMGRDKIIQIRIGDADDAVHFVFLNHLNIFQLLVIADIGVA
ncbi:hypothetical protein SDC9_109897 [bioreactor metagenome]|uniref:Uncharacterized protein n=1 Tax=bioreactor metagenome TaxID=1076179 RepID=A0A645BC17_9ZZZZ